MQRGDSVLGSHEPQQRRTPGVSRTFVQFGLVLDQLDDLEVLERFAHALSRVEVRNLSWAIGLLVQLPGWVALENQHAAGLQGSDHVGEQARPHLRIGELDEDRGHAVVALRCPVVFIASSRPRCI